MLFFMTFTGKFEQKISKKARITRIFSVLYTQPLNHKDDLDNDIVKQMSSLGCFKSCDDLTQNLIDSRLVFFVKFLISEGLTLNILIQHHLGILYM